MVLQRPGSVPTADLTVVAITGGGPGNRNDPVHYRGSDLEFLCQTHGRVYADGGYRGITELQHRCSAANTSAATMPGADTGGNVLARSTPSRDSKTGRCSATTAGAANTCPTRSPPPTSTTYGPHYGTSLTLISQVGVGGRGRK